MLPNDVKLNLYTRKCSWEGTDCAIFFVAFFVFLYVDRIIWTSLFLYNTYIKKDDHESG